MARPADATTARRLPGRITTAGRTAARASYEHLTETAILRHNGSHNRIHLFQRQRRRKVSGGRPPGRRGHGLRAPLGGSPPKFAPEPTLKQQPCQVRGSGSPPLAGQPISAGHWPSPPAVEGAGLAGQARWYRGSVALSSSRTRAFLVWAVIVFLSLFEAVSRPQAALCWLLVRRPAGNQGCYCLS